MNFTHNKEFRSADESRSWLEYCLSLTSATASHESPPCKTTETGEVLLEILYCCCTLGLCAAGFALLGLGVIRVAEDMIQTSQPSYPQHLGTPSAWRF